MQTTDALPDWRREFVDTLALASEGYLDQVEQDTERDLEWWRTQARTPPDEEWPTAVQRMIRANEDRLFGVRLERARRARQDVCR